MQTAVWMKPVEWSPGQENTKDSSQLPCQEGSVNLSSSAMHSATQPGQSTEEDQWSVRVRADWDSMAPGASRTPPSKKCLWECLLVRMALPRSPGAAASSIHLAPQEKKKKTSSKAERKKKLEAILCCGSSHKSAYRHTYTHTELGQAQRAWTESYSLVENAKAMILVAKGEEAVGGPGLLHSDCGSLLATQGAEV